MKLGLGSAPIAIASAQSNNPIKEGLNFVWVVHLLIQWYYV